jgi:hypothetical protein
MSSSPQDIRDKLLNLVKDKDRLLVGLTTIDEKERINIVNVLKLIEKNSTPTQKKSKHQKEPQLLSNQHIIYELKKNLKINIGDKYIKYIPTDEKEINKITELDVIKDIEVIKKAHSLVSNNEIKANAFALYEAYYRGKLYFKLKSKFPENKSFIDYCEENFDVSKSTVYKYLNVFNLYEDFPSILLSGFGVDKLYKNRNLIINSAKDDQELNTLLTKPFPGVKSENIKIYDPVLDDIDANMDGINLK